MFDRVGSWAYSKARFVNENLTADLLLFYSSWLGEKFQLFEVAMLQRLRLNYQMNNYKQKMRHFEK
jgi:hypothetical protein